jgi:hypothetical protein
MADTKRVQDVELAHYSEPAKPVWSQAIANPAPLGGCARTQRLIGKVDRGVRSSLDNSLPAPGLHTSEMGLLRPLPPSNPQACWRLG